MPSGFRVDLGSGKMRLAVLVSHSARALSRPSPKPKCLLRPASRRRSSRSARAVHHPASAAKSSSEPISSEKPRG
jgi:hypothetical protein